MLFVSSYQQALTEISHYQPDVLIIRFGELWAGEPIRLIHSIRSHWRPPRVIALAKNHSDELETAARGAGVHCYLPDEDTLDIVHEAVLSLRRKHATRYELQDFDLNERVIWPGRWDANALDEAEDL